MAVQTNDAVLLPITFGTQKFCENFINEDNFNNTFLLIKVIPVIPITWNAAKVVKRIEKQKKLVN